MKLISNLILLSLLLVSCGEEIQQDLDDVVGETSSPSSSTSDGYSFKIEINNDDLRYKLHQFGTSTDGCKFSGTTVPDHDDYDYTDTDYAMDCILDVGELDLYYSDIELTVSSTGEACHAVKFHPFTFFQYMPGETNRTIYQVECDDVCELDAATRDYCGNIYSSYTAGSPGTLSGQLESAAHACVYDYSTQLSGLDIANTPNCDSGEYIVTTVSLNDIDTNGSCDDADIAISALPTSCSGEAKNCLAGPGSDMVDNFPTRVSTIYQADASEEVSVDLTIPNNFDNELYSNKNTANYIRQCYDTSTVGKATFNNQNFVGYDLEDFAREESSNAITAGAFVVNSPNADSTGDDYADNPFRGNLNRAKPYYEFRCLDASYDTRMQIRLFIREWDSYINFSSSSYTGLSLVSDIDYASPIMDDSGDNEIDDWEDFLSGKIDAQCLNFNTDYDQGTSSQYYTDGNFPGGLL